jgi:hypothetical protein
MKALFCSMITSLSLDPNLIPRRNRFLAGTSGQPAIERFLGKRLIAGRKFALEDEDRGQACPDSKQDGSL